MGDGAREGLAECRLSVRNGPRNGLVEGVKVNSGFEAERDRGESSLAGPTGPVVALGLATRCGRG